MNRNGLIINTYDQLKAAVEAKLIPKKHALAITYTRPRPRIQFFGVHIYSPFFKTDPSAAWYDHNKRCFHGERAEATFAAELWAKETYGYGGLWKRNAMQDLVPEIVQTNFPIPRRKKTS